MKFKQRARRWALVGAFAVTLGMVAPSSQAYEYYPGLPDSTFGNWTSTSQSGMAYTKRAKQWFKAPAGIVTTEYVADQKSLDQTIAHWEIRAESYFVSPDGAPEQFGYMEPMTVRSVGFGIMPVEATVQISQRRRNGFPVPVPVLIKTDQYKQPDGTWDEYNREFVVEDSVNVRVLSVRVDGQDMQLNGNCRTKEPAPFRVVGPETVRRDTDANPAAEWYAKKDPETYYHPLYGGSLKGAITIPPFTGCTTSAGDDLSRLITLAASGPDNPMQARSGWPFSCIQLNETGSIIVPAPPGKNTPKKANCAGPQPFEYPERDE
ncbi:hypothetical protein EFK50_11645 [Nocardioides marmoriginsengisoli]|uniref:Secreted protein n=1 Tax=Nocardioides marmoriginsengisoli TaxID=661483 RepID=A0A3N0CGR5_9ACTN|nr:hypothetical protein [Nocardioides marmoriginsengisoli]RNL62421.1 hypothetical protein EFK50_11645 [Nocardioides marmoriginsengisoli]